MAIRFDLRRIELAQVFAKDLLPARDDPAIGRFIFRRLQSPQVEPWPGALQVLLSRSSVVTGARQRIPTTNTRGFTGNCCGKLDFRLRPGPSLGAPLITRFAIPVKRPVGYVQLTLAGKITFADIDFSRIVERPLEDLIGRCFIDMVAGNEQDLATARLKALVRGRKPSQACKNYVTPGGRSVPVLTTAWIEYDCEGSPIGIGGTDQPMTKLGLERLRASH